MRVQKYNFFPQLQSFFQEISSTFSNLFKKRAYTNRKSDSLFMNDSRLGHTGASSANAVTMRSARRHTVRHTWHWAAEVEPPGRIKVRSAGSWVSSASIYSSSCNTWVELMAQGGVLSSVYGMARCVPTSNRRDCIHCSLCVSDAACAPVIAASRPRWAFNSSMVP